MVVFINLYDVNGNQVGSTLEKFNNLEISVIEDIILKAFDKIDDSVGPDKIVI